MPSIVTAEPQNTGAMEPLLTPWWIPWRISSRVNCSPEKNFSNRASSVSAMASLIAAIRPSSRWPVSGISVSEIAPPSYL